MRNEKKNKLLQLRRWRIRKQISGSAERPRMSVRFAQRNIHVQFIDDTAGRTLAAVSTVGLSAPAEGPAIGANVVTAKRVGALAAETARGRGITRVVFDRSGARYHGKVKALADAAREGGLQF